MGRLLMALGLVGLASVVWAQEIKYSPRYSSGVDLKAISSTATQATGTSEEVVRTYSIPAGLLAKCGDALRLKLSVTVAANANAKTIRLRLGGLTGTQVFLLAGGMGTSGISRLRYSAQLLPTHN